jgi:drug/metabolite transporter (DMT)-like permease
MWIGTLFALAAGLMWGLVFVAPLLLPDYPAALLSFGRYLAFGLIALPIAALDRVRLAQLTRADWLEAIKLSCVGNLLYYLCLAAAIQRAGGPLPTMIIGTLPVVIAISSNLRDARRDGRLRWRQLAPSLALIGAGIALVNQVELAHLRADAHADIGRYVLGALLAVGALVCWTWYPIRNADWLREHPGRSPRSWATAQGIATLPLALAGTLGFWGWNDASGQAFSMPFGPTPGLFIGLMLAIGLLASWLGTLCWNEASQRLPTTLVGQLIVFETLSALAYAFMLRREWPELATLAGIVLLVAGVVSARRSPSPELLSRASRHLGQLDPVDRHPLRVADPVRRQRDDEGRRVAPHRDVEVVAVEALQRAAGGLGDPAVAAFVPHLAVLSDRDRHLRALPGADVFGLLGWHRLGAAAAQQRRERQSCESL